MSLSEAAKVVGAEFIGTDREFFSVSTDSRRLEKGALFVALRGDRFDGHDYIKMAMAGGAAGVLGERDPIERVPTIRTRDSLAALQSLAADWRGRFDMPLVAVTGSNGKTTLKEMTGAILSRAGETLVSEGNFNNHIGVPLSLLKLRDGHRYAVIEMGMNHAGELTVLSRLAAPTVAIVNNAAAAHLEGLGSVERVAEAKGEIFSGLGEAGIALINADDRFADYWRGLNRGRRIITFGMDSAGADVRGAADVDLDHSRLSITFGGSRVDVRLPVAGAHNARNAVAAAAIAFALDIEPSRIAAGLESFRPVAGRGGTMILASGARLIDDTYNANPASFAAAIETLARFSGTRILVMGDMAELGDRSSDFHRETGRIARQAGIDRLLGLGPNTRLACEEFGAGATAFDSVEQLVMKLAEAARGDDVTVLVKGSRSMRMERVCDGLTRAGGEMPGGSR